jgi:preprotein translocase subunit SecD
MSLRWRAGMVVALVALFAYLTAANFVPEERRAEAWWLPDEGVRLGLDLRGGIHMVISPDLVVALSQELNTIRNGLESQLEEKGIVTSRLALANGRIEVAPQSISDAAALREAVDDLEVVKVSDLGEGLLSLELTSDWQDEVRERAMLQTLEVLRLRVDDPATGIQESVVTRQGQDRILVQIPGVSRVPDIFNQTGFLEFKIVDDSDLSEELLLARLPDGVPEAKKIYLEKDRETDRVLRAYLMDESPAITGEYLEDARIGFDSRLSEWQVEFQWNNEGASIFGELTGENVGNLLAIVIDNQVKSAPVIRDRISRNGVITGNFGSQEAADLAVILRAGSLPIPVVLEEERSIGPALGSDSIRRGLRASLLGLLLVMAFTFGYYRLSGGYASLALLANLTLVIGLLSLFEGTLTLPGIAGLVLTVGMAVDANVIIFERIREELRSGKTPRAAIATGFSKARWTILDANITTLITAIILFEYGTGPIKGFAVTLSAGILTSVFAALVITRLFFMIYPGDRNVAELSI